MIFHLCEKKNWDEAKLKGHYEDKSLVNEGFIHLSSYGQIFWVANKYYKQLEQPILLAIDNNQLGAELKWEGLNGLDFPHLYRRIEIKDVLKTIPLSKDSSGNYFSNTELEQAAQAIKINSQRINLREFRIEDEASVTKYTSDADLVKFMPWGPNDQQETFKFLTRNFIAQSLMPRKAFDFCIEHNDTKEVIGSAGLFITSEKHQTGFIGYVIKKEAHGLGYATEAAKALINFGFVNCQLHRIQATCDSENTASYAVMKKIGMKHEGLLRENEIMKNKRRSTIICAILKGEQSCYSE